MNIRRLMLASSFVTIALSTVSASAATRPGIVIDASKPGPPVSKYIYSQFIEHLGRCIYGGIWAEMLEDRKFFLAVGAKDSPWKPIGREKTVTMVTKDACVGKQEPQIAPGGGIAQGGLGLVKGKSYVGRIRLAADAGAGPVTVSLIWGAAADDRQCVTIGAGKVPRNFLAAATAGKLRFTAGADSGNARIEITVAGKSPVRVGAVSLMPADNVHGMRADVLALLKRLGSPLYRWPGGNFVSGYDFRDGLGEVDRRPPRKNPAWWGLESNDFGLDEFIAFCRQVGAEPLIVVNSGRGDVKMALAELQYANGAPDTPMGKLRAKNGHREPYAVKWWGIGNEMYGRWQLGYMPLEKYIVKHNKFAAAMRAADRRVKLVAVGHRGKWSEGMMQNSAGHMDLISEHFYCGEKTSLDKHVSQISLSVKRIADAHRQYRKRFDSLKGRDIRVALDEWNYCYSWRPPYVYGQLGHRCYLKDCLGTAAGLHELIRSGDIIFMANYSITVNVIGCVKATKTAAAMATTGLVMQLYRKHFGMLPLAVKSNAPTDVAAALTEDRRTLTLAIVNPTTKKLDLPLAVTGIELTGKGVCRQIAGDDPKVYNEPGVKPRVEIKTSSVNGCRSLTAAPCSVTLYSLAVK